MEKKLTRELIFLLIFSWLLFIKLFKLKQTGTVEVPMAKQ